MSGTRSGNDNSKQISIKSVLNHLEELPAPAYKNIGELTELNKNVKNARSVEELYKLMMNLTSFPDAHFFNQLLQTLGNLKASTTLKIFYHQLFTWQKSNNEKLIDEWIHATVIVAAGNSEDMELAKEAYRNAVKQDLASVVTYGSMIQVAGNQREIKIAYQTYQDALQKKIASPITHINMIVAAGENGEAALAYEAYQNAIHEGITIPAIHNAVIVAAGENKDLTLAKEAYQYAIEENFADTITHCSIITVAGNNQDLDFSKKIYKKLLSEEIADSATHHSMLTVAGKNGNLTLAMEAYTNAIKLNPDDVIAHSAMIDTLILNKKIPQALKIYEQNRELLKLKIKGNANTNNLQIDLHGQSYGTTYLGLKEYFSRKNLPKDIFIITGRGLGSKKQKDHSPHPVRKAVLDLAEELKANFKLSAQEAGHVVFSSQLTPSAASSPLASHSSFTAQKHAKAKTSAAVAPVTEEEWSTVSKKGKKR